MPVSITSRFFRSFSQPWFFKWKWGDQPWNAPYLKMVPDDLHTVFGGVLGDHFFGLLEAVADLHPLGKTAFLETMNVRLHQIYLYYNPGLRLPASKEFFTSRYATPNYEWKAVMQVHTLYSIISLLFRIRLSVWLHSSSPTFAAINLVWQVRH